MTISGRTTIALSLGIAAVASGALLFVNRRVAIAEPPVPADVTALDPALAAAIDEISRAIRARPRAEERWTRLGLVYEAAALLALAAEAYAVAASLAPDDGRAWYRLANVNEGLGRLDDAARAMERAIAADPSYVPAHRRLGGWRLDAGDVNAARQSFRRALALNDGDAASWFGLAQIEQLEGHAARALVMIEEHVAPDADAPRVARLHARALIANGRADEAKALLARSRGAGGAWPDPWNDDVGRYLIGDAALRAAAGAFQQAGQPGRAADLYARLTERHADDDRLYALLGIALAGAGRIDESRDALRRALEINSDSFPAHLYLARVAAQEPRSAPDELSLALGHAERATELNPSSRLALRVKAQILVRRGAGAAAVPVLKQAFAVDARDAAPLVEAGFIECDLGRWPDAHATFSLAVTHDPDRADAHVGLAIALMEIGDLAAAEQSLARAGRLATGDPRRRMAATARLRALQETEATSGGR